MTPTNRGAGSATRPLSAERALEFARRRLLAFEADLALLVNIDSGSHNPAGVNAVADVVQQRMGALGWTVTRQADPGGRSGDTVIARCRGEGSARVLLLAHMDTVFDDGTAQERPFTVRGGRAYGPGVADDKGGLLAGVAAAGVLADAGVHAFEQLILCASPDEEIGSPSAQQTITELAAGCDAVLCLECAREDGTLVTARKGIIDLTVDIRGRAAHPGIEPERGANAAVAAARLALVADGLNGTSPGASVNVGRLRAGARTNVVPDTAQLVMEARARTETDLNVLVEAIRLQVEAMSSGATNAELRLSAYSPPWETSPASLQLVDAARVVAAEQGLAVTAAATGGAADANYAAATGTPTLDGLGPVGGNDHSPAEWLDLTSVVPRVALLARLIAHVSQAGDDAR